MEQKIIQAVLGILVALMAWNFKTVNSLQQDMAVLNNSHVSAASLHELQRKVDRLTLLLELQASEK